MTGTSFRLVPGMTLLISGTGPANDRDRNHLCVVLTETCPQGMNLVVPICSITALKHDQSCELAVGDHDFVKHPSFLSYSFAETYSVVVIASRVDKKLIEVRNPVSNEILTRVIDGLGKSPFCPPKFKRYFKANCPDDHNNAD